MPQPDHVISLGLTVPDSPAEADIKKYFDKCAEKIGFVPNAVVVSSVNRCYYCLVAHGQAVRKLSGDPELGEMLVMNYRVAELSKRQRAMLDFAWKLTETPSRVEEPDRAALREAGFSEEEIWDIGETVAFYNFSNRMAFTTEMMPNKEYHKLDR